MAQQDPPLRPPNTNPKDIESQLCLLVAAVCYGIGIQVQPRGRIRGRVIVGRDGIICIWY